MRILFQAAPLVPRFTHLTAALADRMNQDLVIDDSQTRADIASDPRALHYDADGGEPVWCPGEGPPSG
jgi:hypothetical protein